MIQFSKTDFVDLETYTQRLNKTGEIFMDMTGVHAYANEQQLVANTLRRLCHRYMNSNSRTGYLTVDKHSVIDYLQRTEYVPEEKFTKKGVAGSSLDKEKVLKPLYESGVSPDFLSMYMKHQESTTRSGNMAKLIMRSRNREKINGVCGELTKIPFVANQTLNLRFNYSQEGIIGFPKEMKDVIYAPEDYCLAWGDFSQIDARVAYNILLKDESNYKYIAQFPDDIYAGFANWVNAFSLCEMQKDCKRLESVVAEEDERYGTAPSYQRLEEVRKKLADWKPFNGFKDKKERGMYKVYCLQTIYGTRYHKVAEASAFIKMFGKVLASCPKYKKYWDDVMKRTDLGTPINVSCYFGHSELVPAVGGRMKMGTLYKCLNYPVQGTSSEILILTCNNLLNRLYAKGYTEDQVRVYYVRHDEPIFILHKDVMKDSHVFKEFENIYIDNWLPLNLTFSFGDCYGTPSEGLMGIYDNACVMNSADITPWCGDKSTELSEHYPLDKLFEVGVHVQRDGNKIVTCFYDEESHSFDTCMKEFDGDILDTDVLKVYVEQFISSVRTRGYTQAVVYNLCDYFEDTLFDGLPVFFRPISANAVMNAKRLTGIVLDKINGVPFEVTEDTARFLSTLKKLNVFGVNNEIT